MKNRGVAGLTGGSFRALNIHALPIMAPLFFPGEGEGGEGGGGEGGGGGGGGTKDAAYWEAEAKKAFTDRDKVKAKLRELEGKVLTDDDRKLFDTLKTQQADLEEKRKRAEGEFDSLKNQLVTRHQTELQERDTKLSSLSQRFQRTVIEAEFGRATDLFGGGQDAKTILDVDLGIAALGRYVHVEDDDTDPRGFHILVKKPNGDTIVGKDGNPAPFADAISELIALLPNKDRILRGSGKSGSGNSGGSAHSGNTGTVNVGQPMSRDSFTDPKAREAVRDQTNAAGGLQVGRGFARGRR